MSAFMHRSGLLGGVDVAGGGFPVIAAPSEIPNLEIYLDPNTFSLSQGDFAFPWLDSSGNGNDATIASGDTAGRPTYDDGTAHWHGEPTVQFQAATQYLRIEPDPAFVTEGRTYVTTIDVRAYSESGETLNDNYYLLNHIATNQQTLALRHLNGRLQLQYRLKSAPGTLVSVSSAAILPFGVNTIVVRTSASQIRVTALSGGRVMDVMTESIGGEIDDVTNAAARIWLHRIAGASNGTTNARGQHDFLFYSRELTDSEVGSLADYYNGIFPNEWEIMGDVPGLPSDAAGPTAWDDGTTIYWAYASDSGLTANGASFAYATSPSSDPFNITDQGDVFTLSQDCRKAHLLREGGTWYLYLDDRNNGYIRLFTGATIAGLTENGSSPILTGASGGESFHRMAHVVAPSQSVDSDWHMLLDGRTADPTNLGPIYHYTSSDGISWTADATNNPIRSPSGGNDWEKNSIVGPSMLADGVGGWDVVWSGYTGSLGVLFPHLPAVGNISSTWASLTEPARLPSLQNLLGQNDKTNVGMAVASLLRPSDGNEYLIYQSTQWTGTGAALVSTGYARKL